MMRIGVFVLTSLALAAAGWAESFYIQPHLQNVSTDGATVIWECETPGPAKVVYGLEGSYDQTAASDTADKVRKVRMTGLQPETVYSYRIQEGDTVFEDAFRTAPLPNNDREITFIAMGDTRRWENRFAETNMVEHMMKWNPEFFVINGDLVSRGHDYPLWTEHFERFKDLNGKFMIATARGNHEGSMITDTENDWFGKYHELPGGEPYAFFTWGNTHFVLLSWEQTLLNYQKDTADWLDKHLEGVDAKYTVVCQHFPLYCTGYDSAQDNRKEPGNSMTYELKVLEKNNVDLCIVGHTHIYERLFPIRDNKRDDRDGVLYVVNGGDIGGNFPEWFTALDDDSSTMAKPTYTVVQCKADRMEMRTFCWSTVDNAIAQIDHVIVWDDEAIPQAQLAKLEGLSGEALAAEIEVIGAMMYQPAAEPLFAYLDNDSEQVRRAAATAIRAIGSPDVAEMALAHLNDEDLVVRRELARAIEIALPEKLADSKELAEALADPNQDEAVRQRLMGAYQIHAKPKAALDKAMDVLKSDAPASVRRRAAYAAGRAADQGDVKALAAVFREEEDQYVAERLAWSLNKLTGEQQSLKGDGPVLSSKPGKDRDPFIKEWLKAAR